MDTLVNRIAWLSKNVPNKVAVAFKTEKLTYQTLFEKICTINRILGEMGVEHGDRVCFTALSKPEMIVLYLGIQMAGAVAVFLDKNSTPENMAIVYKECEAKLLITDKPMKEHIKGISLASMREVYSRTESPDGVALEAISNNYVLPQEEMLAELLFTTGTTGKPKGVMLTYKSVYNILQNTIEGIHISEDEIVLLPLPLNHSFALRVLRAVLYKGATVILQNGFTFAKAVEENISNFHCTGMACVPASYEVMKAQMQDRFSPILSKLKYIEFGAGSLSIRQRKEISVLLPDVQIYNTWGSSESGGAIFCDVTACTRESVENEKSAVVGSLGRPLPGKVDVRILDPSAPIETPEKLAGKLDNYFIKSSVENPGRMILKGDMQMAGYWNNVEATAQTLIDGWLLTGDMAYLDDNGNVYMLGRADDIINVGGEKVSPIEVENIAGQYEYIKECACIGTDDPNGITGQIPVLFVVTMPGYNEDELIKFISSKAERYKLPQKFIRLQELPRNRMQKIDRKQLKNICQQYQTGEDIDTMNPVVEAILARRSVRKFTNQEIPKKILEVILKCGYYAPSGHNMQTWRFTAITNQDKIDKLKEMVEITAKERKVHFYGWENPKALILVSNDKRNVDGCQDASCAAENMMLAAQSFGIGSVWLNPLMTLRDVSPVKEMLDDLGIPTGHTVWASVAMGYPVSEGVLLKKKDDVIRFIP